MADETGEAAPGWDAVEAHVSERVVALGPGEPHHWGSDTLPGQDGIDGVSAYAAGDVWLFVSFGFSELFEKESEDLDVSGWGFELTMRVPRSTEAPPTWPVSLLQELGEYVYSSAAPFDAGHRIDTGPLPVDGTPEPLTALAFAPDPELGEMTTPNGRVTFLAAVGVTAAELERMKASTTAEVVEDLKRASPMLVVGGGR